MAHYTYHATFSGRANDGLQVGYNEGPIEFHQHLHPVERAETPPRPSLLIPFARDADFVERGDLVDQIQQQCAILGSTSALVGLGGTGKSQLAIECAYRIRAAAPQTWVLWIHASNAARFEQSYRDIADKARIFGRQAPKVNIFRLVYNWLQDERRRWIMILDNVDDASFLHELVYEQPDQSGNAMSRQLRDYIPQCSNGSILVTSRSHAAALELAEERLVFEIGPMSKEDALSLFKKKVEDQDGGEQMIELVATLDSMPLAIVQAAAYISQRGLRYSLSRYLEDFKKSERRKTTLLNYEGGKLRRDKEAKSAVMTTWQISFDHLRQTAPDAADLLSLMSFFDCQGIPETLLRPLKSVGINENMKDGDVSDEEAWSDSSEVDRFENSVLTLRRYSLIRYGLEKESFEVHSLVQLATRKWLESNDQLEIWKRNYIQRLNTAFPTTDYENWQECQMLFPHAVSIIQHRPKDQDSLKEWASILSKGAWYASESGSSKVAEPMAVEAMKTIETILGKADRETLLTTKRLGLIYKLQERWQEAEALQTQVRETSERILGYNNPITLTSIEDLAWTYYKQGRWKDAEQLQLQATKGLEHTQGHEHPATLTSMSNLALMYQSQSRFKDAEDIQLRALQVYQRDFGYQHILTSMSMAQLAVTYQNQGRFKEAEQLALRSLGISEKLLGDEHPYTLITKRNLGLTYGHQGKWQKAEELEVQVVASQKRILGSEHPETLTSTSNLSSTYQEQGRLKEAEELEAQVLEVRQRRFGTEHPSTLLSQATLASIYGSQGRWDMGERLNLQVVEARQRVLGNDHQETLISMLNLTVAHWKLGRQKEAKELCIRVVEACRRVLGTEHYNTLTGINNLAYIWKAEGANAEAIELMEECVQGRTRTLGPDHPNTLSSTETLREWRRNPD